jgi:5-hydroxyisourate hydrolase
MKRISTHILDLMQGKPATAVPVRLEKQNSNGHWKLLTSTCTGDDGRCPQLLPEDEDFSAGVIV